MNSLGSLFFERFLPPSRPLKPDRMPLMLPPRFRLPFVFLAAMLQHYTREWFPCNPFP